MSRTKVWLRKGEGELVQIFAPLSSIFFQARDPKSEYLETLEVNIHGGHAGSVYPITLIQKEGSGMVEVDLEEVIEWAKEKKAREEARLAETAQRLVDELVELPKEPNA